MGMGVEPVTASLGIGSALVSALENLAFPLLGQGAQAYLTRSAMQSQLRTEQAQRAQEQQQLAQQYAEQYRQQRLLEAESAMSTQRIKNIAATGIILVAGGAAAYLVYKAVKGRKR